MTPSSSSDSRAQSNEDASITSEDRRQRLVILTSRKDEYKSLVESNEFSRKLIQNQPYWALDTESFEIRVTHTGVGKEQTKKLLGKLKPILEGDLLMVAGTAGALHTDLQYNDLFVPTAVAPTDAVDWNHPDQKLLHWLIDKLESEDVISEQDGSNERSDESLNLRMGPLVTSPRPVVDEEQRNELNELTGAMAVDNETAHVIERFSHSDDEEDQWLCVRIISDTTNTESRSTIEDQQEESCAKLNNVLKRIVSSLQN